MIGRPSHVKLYEYCTAIDALTKASLLDRSALSFSLALIRASTSCLKSMVIHRSDCWIGCQRGVEGRAARRSGVGADRPSIIESNRLRSPQKAIGS